MKESATPAARPKLVIEYSYDANGNMTCRVEAGKYYSQVYNVENRLSTVVERDRLPLYRFMESNQSIPFYQCKIPLIF